MGHEEPRWESKHDYKEDSGTRFNTQNQLGGSNCLLVVNSSAVLLAAFRPCQEKVETEAISNHPLLLGFSPLVAERSGRRRCRMTIGDRSPRRVG